MKKVRSKIIGVIFLLSAFIGPSDLLFAEEPATAKVIDISGQVRYKMQADEEWQALTLETKLAEGAHIFAGPDSTCRVSFGDNFKSVTQVKPDSHIVLSSIAEAPKLDVLSGEVYALVKNLQGGKFQVTTPSAVATVRGTAFSFGAEGIGAEMDSTLQVYESVVGLNPPDKPEAEMPIPEGHGAVMGADGTIKKEFTLSLEDIQAGRNFMEQAFETLGLPKPEADAPGPETERSVEEPKDAGDDDRNPSDQGPPDPPEEDPSPDRANQNAERDPRGPAMDPAVDQAVDGVVMDMASDSELSRSSTVSMDTLQHMANNLTDMSYQKTAPDGSMPSVSGTPPPQVSGMDSALVGTAMRNAVGGSDFFQKQTPEVQEQMLNSVGNAFSGPSGPDASGMQDPPMPAYTMSSPSTFSTPSGTFNDLNTMATNPNFISPIGGSTGSFINHNDLASTINVPPPPPQLLTQFMFLEKIKADYHMYVAQNSGSDAGYFGSPRTITNFTYVKDDVGYVGSIRFTPDTAGVVNNTFQANSVLIMDNPSGSTGNVVFSPTSSGSPVTVPTT